MPICSFLCPDCISHLHLSSLPRLSVCYVTGTYCPCSATLLHPSLTSALLPAPTSQVLEHGFTLTSDASLQLPGFPLSLLILKELVMSTTAWPLTHERWCPRRWLHRCLDLREDPGPGHCMPIICQSCQEAMFNCTLKNKVQGTKISNKTHTHQTWSSGIRAIDLSKWQGQLIKQMALTLEYALWCVFLLRFSPFGSPPLHHLHVL